MGSKPDDPKGKSLLELDEPTGGAAEAIADSGLVPVPTVKPPLDLEKYAKEHAPAIRDRAMTLTDEVATEQARIASVLLDSTPPAEEARPSAVEAIRARLAPLSRVPELAKSPQEPGALGEDPRTVFVLGFVDGVLPLETIIEVTGLPELETLEILERAVSGGAIIFPQS